MAVRTTTQSVIFGPGGTKTVKPVDQLEIIKNSPTYAQNARDQIAAMAREDDRTALAKNPVRYETKTREVEKVTPYQAAAQATGASDFQSSDIQNQEAVERGRMAAMQARITPGLAAQVPTDTRMVKEEYQAQVPGSGQATGGGADKYNWNANTNAGQAATLLTQTPGGVDNWFDANGLGGMSALSGKGVLDQARAKQAIMDAMSGKITDDLSSYTNLSYDDPRLKRVK